MMNMGQDKLHDQTVSSASSKSYQWVQSGRRVMRSSGQERQASQEPIRTFQRGMMVYAKPRSTVNK